MVPYYDDGTVTIYHGDCRAVPVSAVDSVVTDPPYELNFMGRAWDRSGVAFDPATWRVIFDALKPGGRVLAFGGTRTQHRMVCAIEDAGFVIEDTIAWLYGSGFPKHKSKLKPAHEPIVVAWKPDARATPLNIDACRIGTTKDVPASPRKAQDRIYGRYEAQDGTEGGHDPNLGRWPANVALDPDAAALLDAQSGERRSAGPYPVSDGWEGRNAVYSPGVGKNQGRLYGDTGGASRFFLNVAPDPLDGPRFAYVPKASRRERGISDHPTVKPLALMRWLVRLVTPPGGTVYDPFAGSGTTLLAARAEGFRAIGCDLSEHNCGIAVSRLGGQVPMLLEGAAD